MQHASGKKFQDILEEAFVRPLNVEGEFYIGIPPGEIYKKIKQQERLCTFFYQIRRSTIFLVTNSSILF